MVLKNTTPVEVIKPLVGSNRNKDDFIQGNIADAIAVLKPMSKASNVSHHVNLDWMMKLRESSHSTMVHKQKDVNSLSPTIQKEDSKERIEYSE